MGMLESLACPSFGPRRSCCLPGRYWWPGALGAGPEVTCSLGTSCFLVSQPVHQRSLAVEVELRSLGGPVTRQTRESNEVGFLPDASSGVQKPGGLLSVLGQWLVYFWNEDWLRCCILKDLFPSRAQGARLGSLLYEPSHLLAGLSCNGPVPQLSYL